MKTILIFIFLLITSELLAQTEYDQIIKKGCELIDQKKYTEAVAMLQKAHTLDQKRIESYYYSGLALSNVCFKEGNLCKEAVTMLNVSINIDSTFMNALYNRGVCFSRVGLLEEALKDFNSALKLDNEDPDSYANRGLVYYQMNELKKACEDFNIAIKLGSEQGINLKNTFCK
jgi:tetratricopeptide (TPR) repeat protein